MADQPVRPRDRLRILSVIYPTGKKQENAKPRGRRYFEWADVVAGDFHYIRRHMPQRMDGKVVNTTTTTAEEMALLGERGVSTLVTTTPEFEGRSFGTNVMEAALIALAGKRPEEMAPDGFLEMLRLLQWSPRIARLGEAAENAAVASRLKEQEP